MFGFNTNTVVHTLTIALISVNLHATDINQSVLGHSVNILLVRISYCTWFLVFVAIWTPAPQYWSCGSVCIDRLRVVNTRNQCVLDVVIHFPGLQIFFVHLFFNICHVSISTENFLSFHLVFEVNFILELSITFEFLLFGIQKRIYTCMSHCELLLLMSWCLFEFSLYSSLVIKLLSQDVVVLVHQTILVIHHVVSCGIDPGHWFIFRLPLHHLNLHALVASRASNLWLIVLKCQRVQSFHFLHGSQLMFVAVSNMCGRRSLCHFFPLPHHVFP